MDKISAIRESYIDAEKEFLRKKAVLEKAKVESSYNAHIEKIASAGSLEISETDMEFGEGSITKENDEYLESIRNRYPFVNNVLSDFICLGGKTVYLIGGCTGKGKSTVVANIVEPILDLNKKVLVITNEEAREDVYNRVACQRLGKSFRLFKRSALHELENKQISAEAERLQSVLTVISTGFKNNPDFTTTPEGIKAICDKFAPKHDLIILDYYQNINHGVASSGDTRPDAWVYQEKFCHWVNHFKNSYGKPIVVFSQLMQPTKNDAKSFEERVMGRKYISTVSLVHIEIRADFENYTTQFYCHKDRFWGMAGQHVTVGFDWTTNRFVEYDEAFQAKAAQWQLRNQASAQNDAQENEDGKSLEELAEGDNRSGSSERDDDLLVLEDLI